MVQITSVFISASTLGMMIYFIGEFFYSIFKKKKIIFKREDLLLSLFFLSLMLLKLHPYYYFVFGTILLIIQLFKSRNYKKEEYNINITFYLITISLHFQLYAQWENLWNILNIQKK